jgi:mono/diheme cytochrome c family protein
MHRFVFAAAGLFFLTLAAAAQTPAPPPASGGDVPGAKLPPGDGRDVVMRVCTKCHDPSIAAGEDLDGSGWKDLVDQMAANGAQGSDADFDTIVAYLTKAFPAK